MHFAESKFDRYRQVSSLSLTTFLFKKLISKSIFFFLTFATTATIVFIFIFIYFRCRDMFYLFFKLLSRLIIIFKFCVLNCLCLTRRKTRKYIVEPGPILICFNIEVLSVKVRHRMQEFIEEVKSLIFRQSCNIQNSLVVHPLENVKFRFSTVLIVSQIV